jgi:plastocyanin
VTGSLDGTARIWEAATGYELTILGGGPVTTVSFSPNGKQVVTSGLDWTPKTWDVATGRELIAFRGHTNSVWGVSYSPDGKQIVTGSQDGTARIWDAATGRELTTLRGLEGPIGGVSFSPDGKVIATGDSNGTVRFHFAQIDDLIRLMRTWTGRDLSCEENRKYLHVDLCPSPIQTPKPGTVFPTPTLPKVFTPVPTWTATATQLALTPTVIPAPLPTWTPGPTASFGLICSGSCSVIMRNNAFEPSTLTITKGTTVTWLNIDIVTHTVTSGTPGNPTGIFRSNQLGGNQTFAFKFDDVGNFPYFCEIHGAQMTGTITVVK